MELQCPLICGLPKSVVVGTIDILEPSGEGPHDDGSEMSGTLNMSHSLTGFYTSVDTSRY